MTGSQAADRLIHIVSVVFLKFAFHFLMKSSSSRCVLKEVEEVPRTRNENRNESQSPDFFKKKSGSFENLVGVQKGRRGE